ncbi:MAG: hypothetical protein LH473_05325 [Chitinophagales bacterium]|nr:hypothetical protein [Chitinophagales bacterium]
MKSIAVLLALTLIANLSAAQIFENSTLTKSTFIASSFINDNEGWLADNNGMLFRTINGGQKWDSIIVEQNFLKLAFSDALVGYAISSDGLY